MRWLGLGIGLGLGLAAWRNAPPVLYPQHEAFGVVVVVATLGLFFGRRRGKGAEATAVAVAHGGSAEAAGGNAAVQVNLHVPGAPTASVAYAELDDMPWIDPTGRPALEAEIVGELDAERGDDDVAYEHVEDRDPMMRWLDL